ncbi:MAG TPA: biotin transporter BioY [Bacillales bacterium]|nr:biotin transporter BioY [Bacillales bacterium]
MKTKEMVYVALFAAVVAVLGLMPPIPMPFLPSPITLQTLGVMLAGAVLGARLGFFSMLLFLVLVTAGLPLIAGGRGGLAVFVGPSGGFFLSWPFAAWVIGFLTDRMQHRLRYWHSVVFNIVGGMGVVYLIGIPYMAWMSGTPLWTATLGSLIFFPGDLTKTFVAAYLAVRLRRSLSLNQRMNKKEHTA